MELPGQNVFTSRTKVSISTFNSLITCNVCATFKLNVCIMSEDKCNLYYSFGIAVYFIN